MESDTDLLRQASSKTLSCGRLANTFTGSVVDGLSDGASTLAPHVLSQLGRQQETERAALETHQPVKASSKGLSTRRLAPTFAGSAVAGLADGSAPRTSSQRAQHQADVTGRVIAKNNIPAHKSSTLVSGDTLQPVKANRTSRGPDEKSQQFPVAGPSRQQSSSETDTSLLPNSLSLAPQLEDRKSLHSKKNAGTPVLRNEAEITIHTPMQTARLSVPTSQVTRCLNGDETVLTGTEGDEKLNEPQRHPEEGTPHHHYVEPEGPPLQHVQVLSREKTDGHYLQHVPVLCRVDPDSLNNHQSQQSSVLSIATA